MDLVSEINVYIIIKVHILVIARMIIWNNLLLTHCVIKIV